MQKHDIDKDCGGCMVPHPIELPDGKILVQTCLQCRRCHRVIHPSKRDEECNAD